MEEVLSIVRGNTGNPDQQLLRALNGVQHVLLQSADRITTTGSTELLRAAEEIHSEQLFVKVYFLKIQSENLKESCFNSFIRNSIEMLSIYSTFSSDVIQAIGKETLTSICVVSRKLVGVLHVQKRAGAAILSLLRVIQVLCPAPNTLTTLHAVLMEAYVSAGMHDHGYTYTTSNPLFKVNADMCCSLSFDALTYFYYSGMCCLAVKKYETALHFFVDAVTTPCPGGVSAVAIAALKKARICSLLTRNPKVFEIPRYATQSLIRHFKQEAVVYDTIQKCFDSDNYTSLKEYVYSAIATNELQKDGNYGLAKQTLKALLKKRIRCLENVFSRMTLSDIHHLKFSDTDLTMRDIEVMLVELRNSGELCVRICRSEGIVTFQSSELAAPSADENNTMLRTMTSRLEESLAQAARIRSIQSSLYKNPAYVSKKIAGMKGGGGGPDDISNNPILSDMMIDYDDFEDTS